MMSVDYTGQKTGQFCKQCNQGELYQFPQDLPGQLRCGRCGEPHKKAEQKPATTTRKAS